MTSFDAHSICTASKLRPHTGGAKGPAAPCGAQPASGGLATQGSPTFPEQGEQGKPGDGDQAEPTAQVLRRVHGEEAGPRSSQEASPQVRWSTGPISPGDGQMGPQ